MKGEEQRDNAKAFLNRLGYQCLGPYPRKEGFGQNVEQFSDPSGQIVDILLQVRRQDDPRDSYWLGLCFRDVPKTEWVAIWIQEYEKIYLIPSPWLKKLLLQYTTSGALKTLNKTQCDTEVDPALDLFWFKGSTDVKHSIAEFAIMGL